MKNTIDSNQGKKRGFSRVEFLVWLLILPVLAFQIIPFYNSLKKDSLEANIHQESNTSFHFESWNQDKEININENNLTEN